MLKIKDNVDFEELEKFKFKPKYNQDTGEIMYYYREYSKFPEFRSDKWLSRVEIYVESKQIKSERYHRYIENKREIKAIIGKCSDEFDVVEILFDLIQAGLVEKREE